MEAYVALAVDCGMSPTELALRFVMTHPLVASAVVGASDELQLNELLAAALRGPLQEDVLGRINAIHRRYPNPTP